MLYSSKRVNSLNQDVLLKQLVIDKRIEAPFYGAAFAKLKYVTFKTKRRRPSEKNKTILSLVLISLPVFASDKGIDVFN